MVLAISRLTRSVDNQFEYGKARMCDSWQRLESSQESIEKYWEFKEPAFYSPYVKMIEVLSMFINSLVEKG